MKVITYIFKINQTRVSSGFSLIELLIAISIIAVISTIGFTTYSQSQMRGRDAKRKQDLRAIAVALELYYQKNNHYPCSSWLFSYPAPSGGAFWITNDSTQTNCGDSTHAFNSSYIARLPIDPTNNSQQPYLASGGNYSYGYWAGNVTGTSCPKTGNGASYLLVAQLENKSDPARIEVKNQIWCNTNQPLFVSGGSGTIPSGTAFVIVGQ